MPGYNADKEKQQQKAASVVENASCSHLLLTDGHASFPFMRLINIFSGISAILQPRSHAVYSSILRLTPAGICGCLSHHLFWANSQ